MSSRRAFLKAALGAGLATLASSCRPSDPLGHVCVRMHGPDAATGHLLRDPARIPAPRGARQRTRVLLIGGGVSGLTALRTLRRSGLTDSLLLELEAEAGGNSVAGGNLHTRYPWAAHYLPIPDPRNTELLKFLEECGAVTGYRDGLPVYNEYHLCSDPEERLFMNGFWQEGLVPATGISAAEKADTARFFRLVERFRAATGADGRDRFCIPQSAASIDAAAAELDALSFASWLDGQELRAKPLRWYLDYCCLDDYGLPADRVSAWAGLHYFAGRKGRAANAAHSDLLTWPEGNAFLMERLRSGCEPAIRVRNMAYAIERSDKGYLVSVYDARKGESYRIACEQLILAVPQFVAARLLPEMVPELRIAHAPWMVANLTLRQLSQTTAQGLGLCWDNVLYGSRSVGYVNARHQQPGIQTGPVVVTYYMPLAGSDPQAARREALSKSPHDWLQTIVDELSAAHPDLAENLIDAEIRVWGHGMAAPLPGFRGGRVPSSGNLFFAHTDYSGISIFEEAFYQGLRAAEAVLNHHP